MKLTVLGSGIFCLISYSSMRYTLEVSLEYLQLMRKIQITMVCVDGLNAWLSKREMNSAFCSKNLKSSEGNSLISAKKIF